MRRWKIEGASTTMPARVETPSGPVGLQVVASGPPVEVAATLRRLASKVLEVAAEVPGGVARVDSDPRDRDLLRIIVEERVS
ncbi:MAG TPA: hypothetical protein ENK57_03315 [Polyangiaceae bacterium]|nr:hypothetical protein [Polyangiaceae bacterium]